MVNDNVTVLNEIKEEYSRLNSIKGSQRLKLPSGSNFIKDKETITIDLSAINVCKNMQEDACAFEAWALIVKRWAGYKRVILKWKKPNTPNTIEEQHSQRFLFRVDNFTKNYRAWFFADITCVSFLSQLKTNNGEKYLLNKAGARKGIVNPNGEEAKLEARFVSGDLQVPLMNLVHADFIKRQLPVGVFESSISAGSAIFPSRKSAIDLWGISKDNDLLIFELKVKGNKKAGIISELYFYSCVMQKLQTKMFEFKKDNDSSRIEGTKKIKAYFLAPELHPLIDSVLLGEMNTPLCPDIEFHYININIDSLNLIF